MKRLVTGALLAAGTALAISAAPAMSAAAAASWDRDAQRHHRVRGRAGYEHPDGHRQRGPRQGGVQRRRPGRRARAPQSCRCQPGRSGLPQRHHARGQHARDPVVILGQPAQLPVHRDAAAHLGRDRGTGQFDDATGSFTGTASAVALLARNPDGSCSLTPLPFPRHEVDKFAESGTLSF